MFSDIGSVGRIEKKKAKKKVTLVQLEPSFTDSVFRDSVIPFPDSMF